MTAALSPLNAGVGLRTGHYSALMEARPAVGFLEVHSENFFCAGGQPLDWLTRFRALYPLSFHGVGLSLGRADDLDKSHLSNLQRLVERFEPVLVSEHLCWTGVGAAYGNDLLPLPYTREALAQVVRHIDHVQTRLKRRILVENVSSYLGFRAATLTEWEFLAEVARASGCGVLLDVNNVYVNSVNHGFDARGYIQSLDPSAVMQIHLAGFDRLEEEGAVCLIDTHGKPVSEAVWALYAFALEHLGPRPTLIEWDTDLPPLPVLLGEAAHANQILAARHADPFPA